MILQRRHRGLAVVHGGVQIVLIECLFMILPQWHDFSLVIRTHIHGFTNYGVYAWVIALSLLFDLGRSLTRNLPVLRLGFFEAIRRSARQVSTMVVGLLMFLVLTKDTTISRSFLATFLGVALIVLVMTNKFLPALVARTLFSRAQGQRTLIFGDSSDAEKIWDWMEARSALGFEVVGVLDPQDRRHLDLRLAEYDAQQLIVLGLPKSLARIQSFWRACEKAGVRLLVLSNSESYIGRSIEIDELEGMQFVSFQKDLLECPLNRAAKRLFDLAIAAPVCMFILPPLSFVVWLLQRWQAPGPLFFRQKRSGVHGREFSIFKFRSMFLSSGAEEVQATAGDSRIFRAGRWLRKTSMDELPQFLNVLRGDMSIVGPRPHLQIHDNQFALTANAYRLRQFIKPGITGLAQVSGWRGEARTTRDVQKRTDADIEYLQKWTLFLDLRIVVRTGWQVLFPPRTAY